MSSNADDEANLDPYAALGLTPEATEKDIKTAYRKSSLKCHPDRNPDNPQAAQQFHLLSLAQAILLDGPRRAKYDAKLEEKARKAARVEGFASRKRGLVSDLVAREEAYKKAREDLAQKANLKAAESAVQSEGRQLREAAQAAKEAAESFARSEAKRTEKESLNARARAKAEAQEAGSSREVPAAERTLRLSLPLPEFASATTAPEALEVLLSRSYGRISHSFLRTPAPGSSKPSKKGKTKEVVSAVVEFPPDNLSGCWALVEDCRLGRGVNINGSAKAKWAGGGEPEWVARLGTSSANATPPPSSTAPPPASSTFAAASEVPSSTPAHTASAGPPPSPPGAAARAPPSFSFDSSSAPVFSGAPAAVQSAADYENATLLRMRQAERERIEREIREAEMEEE